MPRKQTHQINNVSWLRAAVLGANDGIVSTASLVLGVAGGNAGHAGIVMAAVAGLVGGAMSMATGEYVSVSSQADAEQAALQQERQELQTDDPGEHRELAAIYVRRGLDLALARQVAQQLMAHDALDAHARDELGISGRSVARPLQAALASACSFGAGAALPLAVVILAPVGVVAPLVAAAALVALAIMGGLASATSGASIRRGVVRVTFWSALAMAVTFAIGRALGSAAMGLHA